MSEQNNQAFYDDCWGLWEDQRIFGPVGRHTRRLIRRILAGLSYNSVADVGCGEGSLLMDLFGERHDLRCVGTELSPKAIELARQKNPGLEFMELDIVAGPIPPLLTW